MRICSRVRWQIVRWWMWAGSQALQMARKLPALIFGSSRTVSGENTAIAYSAWCTSIQNTRPQKQTRPTLHIEWATCVSWLILAGNVTVNLLCRSKNTKESLVRGKKMTELKKTEILKIFRIWYLSVLDIMDEKNIYIISMAGLFMARWCRCGDPYREHSSALKSPNV